MFQDVVDVLAILGMFLLRIGAPIVVTVGVGIWLEKKLRPAETQSIQRSSRRGTIIPFPQQARKARASTPTAARCWDVKQCDPMAREQCAAFQRSDLPCWLALQTAGGRVRAECADCEMYAQPQRVVV